MSLIPDLFERLELRRIHHFFYNDKSVGAVKTRMRKLLIVKIHDKEDVLLVMQPSTLSKSSLGISFPNFDKAKYKVDTELEDLNDLTEGVVVKQEYIQNGGKSWLFKLRDIDNTLHCVKMAESLVKRSLQITNVSDLNEDNKELLQQFMDVLKDEDKDSKSTVVYRDAEDIKLLKNDGSFVVGSESVMDRMKDTKLDMDQLSLTKSIQKVKSNWFIRLIKWLFRVK